jgi:hypothetical protein
MRRSFVGELSARDLNDDSRKLAPSMIAHRTGPVYVPPLPSSTVYPFALQDLPQQVAALLANRRIKASNGSDPLLLCFPILSSVHAASILRLLPL